MFLKLENSVKLHVWAHLTAMLVNSEVRLTHDIMTHSGLPVPTTTLQIAYPKQGSFNHISAFLDENIVLFLFFICNLTNYAN